jgi:hypothetical protein
MPWRLGRVHRNVWRRGLPGAASFTTRERSLDWWRLSRDLSTGGGVPRNRQRPAPLPGSPTKPATPHVVGGSGVTAAVRDRQPWWPATLVALCSLGDGAAGNGDNAALEETAKHASIVLNVPEKWQPIEDVIDASRLTGVAAAQLKRITSPWPASVAAAMRGSGGGRGRGAVRVSSGADSHAAAPTARSPAAAAAASPGAEGAEGIGLQHRIRRALRCMESGMLEREGEARLLLLGAIAAQHTLLLGPAGE